MLTLENLRAEVSAALEYIDSKWDGLRTNARDGHQDRFSSWISLAATSNDGHLDDIDASHPYILFLPNDFITPGGRFVVQFYWDSYFIILSLLLSNRFDLAKGMVENCLFLVARHGMVIANRKRWAAGSQLPFLSEMVRQIYDRRQDKSWLAQSIPLLEAEYTGYWLNKDHLSPLGLSRYHAPSCYPADHIPEITIDHEATWDLSPRFDSDDVLQLLPVDLNSNLFSYEENFAYFNQELGNEELATIWKNKADKRKVLLNDLMWDEADGLYYDYNFVSGQRKRIKSLASFFPMFHGLASSSQSQRISSNLIIFEQAFGLATCDQSYGYTDRQWNYPVGWAPLHWAVYKGLKRYNCNEHAVRIALKWLSLSHNVWKQTGKFFEKYDVQNGTHEVLTDRYKNQDGFGWTNAVFHCLVEDLLCPDH